MRPEVRSAVPPGLSRSMQMRALLFRKKALCVVFFFPLLVPELPGRAARAWHFYPVAGWRVEAAGAADTVIYGVSNTVQAPLRCPGITCSSQALRFPAAEGLFLSGHGARFYFGCLSVLVAPLCRFPPLPLFLASVTSRKVLVLVGTCVFLTILALRELFPWIPVRKRSRWQQSAFPRSEQVGLVGCCDSHSAQGCQKAPNVTLSSPSSAVPFLAAGLLEIGFLSSLQGRVQRPWGRTGGVELCCSELDPGNSVPKVCPGTPGAGEGFSAALAEEGKPKICRGPV